MIRQYIILCLILILSTCVHATIPATSAWHVKDAKFRIETTSDNNQNNRYIDLGAMIVPEGFNNGVEPRTASGKKLNFKFYPDSSELAVAPSPPGEDNRIFIYYGFSKSVANELWDKKKHGAPPEAGRLRLKVVRFGLTYYTKEQWLENKIYKIEEKFYNKSSWLSNYINENQLNYRLTAAMNNLDIKLNILLLNEQKRQRRLISQKLRNPRKREFLDYYRLKKNIYQTKSLKRKINRKQKEVRKYQSRVKWAIEKLNLNQQERIKKTTEVKTNVEDGRENEILNRFKGRNWKRRLAGIKAVASTNLAPIPFQRRNSYAACFFGTLPITKQNAGEYTFAVQGSSSCFIRIDDKFVIKWFGEHATHDSWEHSGKIKLEPGLHKFEFYYHKNRVPTYAVAAWKKPGSENWEIIDEKSFAPGYAMIATSLTGSDDKNYPLVERDNNFKLFTGKDISRRVESCTVKSTGSFIWELNSRKSATGKHAQFILQNDNSDKIVLKDAAGNYADMTVIFPPRNREDEDIEPEMALNLWLPELLYDDETLNMYVEAVSYLPFKTDAILKTAVDGKNQSKAADSIFSTGSRTIQLEARSKVSAAKFQPAGMFKEKISLDGAKLKSGATVKYELLLPGLIFSRRQVKFIPLEQCSGLRSGENGLIDDNGNQVVPILHRPTLAELRKWSLPEIISEQLMPTGKVLVIAESDYGLKDAFEQRFGENQADLKFVEREPDDIMSARKTLTDIIALNGKSDCDTAVIIPSINDSQLGLPIRNRKRYLAALIQTLRANPAIKRIMLCTPIPSLNASEYDEEFIKAIRKLSREYSIDMIDLNYFIKQQKNWEQAYRAKDGIRYSFPVGLTSTIAELIAGKATNEPVE